MSKFQTFGVKQEITFGAGSIERVPEIIASKKFKKVCIVADPGIVKTGIVKKLEDMLAAKGLDYITFSDIKPDPPVEKINKGIKLFVEHKSEILVAIGGGSAMDTAKGMAIVGDSGTKVADYWGADVPVNHPVVPILAIPTTAGTGSEVTRNAVITDEKDFKLVLRNDAILPAFAVLDPELLATLPQSVAIDSSMDALIHAMEAYICDLSTPFSDAMAEKAIELIGPSLRPFIARRSNIKAASDMLLGSTFAGIALSLVLPGQAHALSHPLTGFYHLPHGFCNSMLFPAVMEYNALGDMGKYKRMYNLLCPEKSVEKGFTTDMLVDEIKRLNKDFGFPANLAEAGVKMEDVQAMMEDCKKTQIFQHTARETSDKDIIALYTRAIKGF